MVDILPSLGQKSGVLTGVQLVLGGVLHQDVFRGFFRRFRDAGGNIGVIVACDGNPNGARLRRATGLRRRAPACDDQSDGNQTEVMSSFSFAVIVTLQY